MKFLHVSMKGLKEIFRDRKGLGLLLAFPAIFMLVFGFAFSGGQGDNSSYRIGVVSEDRGVTISLAEETGEEKNFGKELVATIESLTFEDSDVPLFDVRQVSPEEGDDLLKEREIAALVSVPENFSDSIHQLIKSTVRREITGRVGEMVITNFTRSSADDGLSTGSEDLFDGEVSEFSGDRTLPKAEKVMSKIVIKGDPGYMAYGQARSILSGVIGRFKDEVVDRAERNTASYFKGEYSPAGDFVTVETESISGSQSFSVFDYQAPGIFVFALLMISIGVAGSLAKEIEAGTLERLKISRMSSFDLLFGTLIPWSVLTVVQVVILFAVALLIGFSWAGGITSLLLAVLVAVIAGIASVSLGLLIAAFADNEQHASNLGTLIAVPLSFIVGAFFPLPKLPIGRLLGSAFEIYDVLPWTHAAEALRTLLIYGGNIGDILLELVFLVGLTVVLFLVGVFFFARERLTSLQ